MSSCCKSMARCSCQVLKGEIADNRFLSLSGDAPLPRGCNLLLMTGFAMNLSNVMLCTFFAISSGK